MGAQDRKQGDEERHTDDQLQSQGLQSKRGPLLAGDLQAVTQTDEDAPWLEGRLQHLSGVRHDAGAHASRERIYDGNGSGQHTAKPPAFAVLNHAGISKSDLSEL